MESHTQKSLWVFKHKLKPFLIGLAEIVHYDLSMSDIDAIEYGINNTTDERNLWWTYFFRKNHCRFNFRSGRGRQGYPFYKDRHRRCIQERTDITDLYDRNL